MSDASRRDFVAGSLAIPAAWALPSMAAAQRATDAGTERWRFFTEAQSGWIEAAVERLIPGEPEWPGAKEAEVAIYIDRQLAGPFGAGERLYLGGPIRPGLPGQGYQLGFTPAEVYRRALESLFARGGDTFARSSDADKDEHLRLLESSGTDLNGVPSSVFFETLLANTVEGYFADPYYGGNKDMASWRMIGFPGAHAAYLGIYTQHGVRFDRPPVSMMEVAAHAHSAGPHHHAPHDKTGTRRRHAP